MAASHAVGPGSIPGYRRIFSQFDFLAYSHKPDLLPKFFLDQKIRPLAEILDFSNKICWYYFDMILKIT